MANSSRIRTGSVRVDGLRELNTALRAIGPDAQKELREASKEVAELVADDARAAAYTVGGVAAHVAPSLRAVAGVKSAGVSFGGSQYPMAGGAEFGSYKYKQFKPWSGNDSGAGYFLYPSIRRDADRITTVYTDRLDGILQRRFPG